MFKRFFKPKWQHVNADIRQQAIAKLDLERPDELGILLQMASKDSSADVRRAAIDRIDRLPPLIELLQSETLDRDGVKDSLHHRISLLLCKSSNTSSKEKLGILERVEEPTLFRYVVMNAQDAALQLAAAAKIEDQDTLEDLAVTAKLAKIRKIAVERIDDAERLKRIELQAKGKDKSVYRIAREKLSAQRAELEAHALATQEARHVVEALERHAASVAEPLYENKWQLLKKQWAALTQAQQAPLEDRWVLANQRCQHQMDQWQEQDYSDDIVSLDDARREQTEVIGVMHDALALIKAETDPLQLDLSTLQGVIATQAERWEKATEQLEPSESDRSAYLSSRKQLLDVIEPVRRLKQKQHHLESQIESVKALDDMSFQALQHALKQLKKRLSEVEWPSVMVKPALLQSAELAMERVASRTQQLKAETKEQVDAIKSGLIALEDAIDEGALTDAKKRLSRLQSRIKRIDGRDAEAFTSKLKLLQGRVNELRDWQGFANTPKKEALIEEMTQLIDLDIDLGEKAQQIKALQEAWKALGPVDSDKGQSLWLAFKEAGDRAFEPCKGYFSQQSQIRQDNLDKRAELCEQLEVYEQANDWSKADWKAVLETLIAAKSSWRAYAPVERKLNAPLQQRFDQIIAKIQARLDEERDRNGRLKARLIERADALIDHDELNEAIDQAKALQSEWKEVGLTHRKSDQAQWKRFRAACDKVFERRQKEKSDDLVAREANQRQLEAICSDLSQILDADDETVLAKKGDIKTQLADVEQLGALPQASAKALRKQFSGVVSAYEQRLQAISARQLAQGYQLMWQKAALCQTLEAGLLSASLTDEMLSDVKSQWSQLGELPAAAEAAINARFDLAINHTHADSLETYRALSEKNGASAKALVIMMEIVSGVESPEADQALRMELQVDRLSGGLGKRASSDLEEHTEIAIQWCATGPIEPHLLSALEARMQKARAQL